MNSAFDSVCFKGSVVSQSARFVYLCLCKHADNTNQTCFPSLNRIAEIVGKSLSTIKRAIRELCKYGVIERAPRFRKDGGQTSNLYKIKDCTFEYIKDDSTVEPETSSIEENQQPEISLSESEGASSAPACTTGSIKNIDDWHESNLPENTDSHITACSEVNKTNKSRLRSKEITTKLSKKSNIFLKSNPLMLSINEVRSWTKSVCLKLHSFKSIFFRKNEPGGGHE